MALVFATALAAFPGAPDAPEDRTCHGDLQGNVLKTTIEFEDGSRLIGPWRVAHQRNGEPAHRVTAVLDRVIEVDGAGALRTMPFPHGIAVLFEGRSERDMIENAAQVWCSTVLRARRAQEPAVWSVDPPRARVTAAALPDLRVG